MDIAEVVEHVCYRIANAPVRSYPFPHVFIEEIFPPAYYEEMLSRWPSSDAFRSQADSGRSTSGHYPDRHIMSLINGETRALGDPFWNEFELWFTGPRFLQLLTTHFRPWIDRSRTMPPRVELLPDAMLVQDGTQYTITPHTDARHRLVSTLFYCPRDTSQRHLGTSLYVPKDQGPVPGISGRHYDREHFTRVTTAEFLPNSMFGFVVGPRSFHGVEPIMDPGTRRNLIMHFVRLSDATLATMPAELSTT